MLRLSSRSASRILSTLVVAGLLPGQAAAGPRPTEDETTGVHSAAAGEREERLENEVEQGPILARLVISTDAAAEVRANGVPIGVVTPERRLLHEVEETSVDLVAEAVDKPGALWRRTVSVAEAGAGDERPEPGRERKPSGETGDLDTPEIRIRIKMLKAVHDLQKRERRDKVWADVESGLMWARQDNRDDVTWAQAARYCAHFELGGWEDWRLPRIDELDLLQAMWSQAAFKTVGTITLSSCCPWSASEIDAESAWNYNFRFRRAFAGQKEYSYDLRALCVRTLPEAEIEAYKQPAAAREKADGKKRTRKGEPATPGVGEDEEAGADEAEDGSGPRAGTSRR